jgi:hypothetical protein
LALLLTVGAGPKPPRKAEILGRWRGTSTCTRIPGNEFCHDEEVAYDFVAIPDSEKVRLKAAKIVDGREEPMYELDFEYQAAEHRWACEFERPRAHGIWAYAVDGSRLTGTLYILPGNEVARHVAARR